MQNLDELTKLGVSRSACLPEQLQKLAELVYHAKDIPGDIIEIGAYRCGSTLVLAAQSEESSPHKKVFAFDTFAGRPASSAFDPQIIPQFESDLNEVKKVTESIPSIELVSGLHEETIPSFPHRPVSLLFLDSDMYMSHVATLQHFWADISVGGFLVLHDFITLNCPGVRKAFDEFFMNEIDTLARKHTYLSGMLVIQK